MSFWDHEDGGRPDGVTRAYDLAAEVPEPTVAPACGTRSHALGLLVNDDLGGEEATRLRRHVNQCDDCRLRLESLRDDADWLRRACDPRRQAELAARLRDRLVAQIGERPPSWWPLAWARRLWSDVATGGPEPIVAAVAGLLLLVGAAGALSRPLPPVAIDVGASAVQEFTPDSEEEIVTWPGDEGLAPDAVSTGARLIDVVDAELGRGAAESPEQADASLRIELATRDPNVRIIWFAQAE